MKKILIALVAALAISFAGQASAADAHVANEAQIAAPAANMIAAKRRKGIFSKLIELERKKNAWLRKTFLS
jgi:hypothetical protein